jgi:hypothetical protein
MIQRLTNDSTLKDVLDHIKRQLVIQSYTSKVKVVLPKKLFFKLIKLILFSIRDSKEDFSNWNIDYECRQFDVYVNERLIEVNRL